MTSPQGAFGDYQLEIYGAAALAPGAAVPVDAEPAQADAELVGSVLFLAPRPPWRNAPVPRLSACLHLPGSCTMEV